MQQEYLKKKREISKIAAGILATALLGKDSCPQAGAHHECAAAKPQAWAGYGTLIFGGYHLNKKKKSNKSGYPDEAIKTLARCFYPSMVEFFNSEDQRNQSQQKKALRRKKR